MPVFRYGPGGNWYKGNTHIHSTASDGGKNFDELAQIYAGAGYDFLFRTDHWVMSGAGADPAQYPLLWLDGMELDGRDATGALYHVVVLGTVQGIERQMGLNRALESARAQNALLVLAHPRWTGNSFEDAARWAFDGVEVYNHICQWLNAKGDGGAYWNAMLERFPNTLAFAADDAHLNRGEPGWNGGWVEVNAEERTPGAILAALRAGRFYATRGPLFHSFESNGEQVRVTCSPAQFAWMVGPAYRGERLTAEEGGSLTEFTFRLPLDWPYAYLQIEDAAGRHAWTNPLWVREPASART